MPVNKNPAHIFKLFEKNGTSEKLHCLGDYLDKLEYNVATYKAGKGNFDGFMKVLSRHGVRNVKDFAHDKELFESLIDGGLAELAGKQPFALYIANVDTMPPLTAQCTLRNLHKGQPGFAAVDCLDQYMESFFAALKKHNLTPENTQIAIFGDRRRTDLVKTKWVVDPRFLFSLYPFGPRNYVSKESSFYDVLPTILDLAEIEYEPKPPFGGNVLNSPNQIPGNREYDDLYRRFET
jgi:phosphoglycerol transferase MdoB-like AlkP superfamily enzyme